MTTWSTYLTAVKDFFRIDSTIMSDAEATTVLTMAGAFIDKEAPTTRTADEETVLVMFKFGCLLFSNKNRSIHLKEGVSNWSIGQINLTYDMTNMKTLGNDFCSDYYKFINLMQAGKKGAVLRFTNVGTGLWQSTQARGPIFVGSRSDWRSHEG